MASCLRQVSVLGTSSQGATEPPEGKLVTFWASSRSTEELRQLQKEEPDIGPIISAKLSGNRPSSKEMVTCSPATKHYWILWDSLVIQHGILLKKFLKRDSSAEYLQFIVPGSSKDSNPSCSYCTDRPMCIKDISTNDSICED